MEDRLLCGGVVRGGKWTLNQKELPLEIRSVFFFEFRLSTKKNHQCKALYSVASGSPAPSTCCFIATIPAPPYDYIITLRHAFLR